MEDVNDVLGEAGAGEVVVAGGKAWTMHHVGPRVRAKFSALIKASARREIESLRRSAGDAAHQRDVAVFHEQLASGAYRWGSPFDPEAAGSAIRTALRSDEGQMVLIGLLLEKAHGEVPPEELGRAVTDNPRGFLDAMAACLGLPPDPNASTPPKKEREETQQGATSQKREKATAPEG